MRWMMRVFGCGMLAINALCACGGDDAGGDGAGGGGTAGDEAPADAGARDAAADAAGGTGGSGDAGNGDAGAGGADADAGAGADAGNGDGAAAPDLPDGIAADAQLSELSEAQVGALCAAFDSELSQAVSAEEAQQLSCTVRAVLASLEPSASGEKVGVDQDVCEQAVDDCVSEGLGVEIDARCEPERVVTAAETCSTSAGAYFACLQGGVARLSEAVDTFTCAALAEPQAAETALGSDPTDLASVPECAAIHSECPALLDGEGSVEPPAEDGCENTCEDAFDGYCDDGGEGADFNLCPLGTDCADCGPR